MNPCETGQTQQECKNYKTILSRKIKLSLGQRDSSYSEKNRGACQGTQKLNKKAFISMLGAVPHSRAYAVAGNSSMEAARVMKEIENQGGDQRKTAAILGMTLRSLRSKLSPPSPNPALFDEQGSPNLTRRYFESLTSPWSIKNFNPSNGEVCIDMSSKSGIAHLSAKVQVPKSY